MCTVHPIYTVRHHDTRNYMIHVAIESTHSCYYLLLHWLPWRLEGMPGQGCNANGAVAWYVFWFVEYFLKQRARFQHAVFVFNTLCARRRV